MTKHNDFLQVSDETESNQLPHSRIVELMTGSQLNFVASELKNTGFETRVKGSSVLVSLKNHQVSQMEVRFALEQIFEDIGFNIQNDVYGILVSL